MAFFAHREFDHHEEVAFFHDAEAGLKAIIAIHNTNRGPAVGGCRMWPYASEAEALSDVLRLSRGMTYKSALAELPYGGGKSVILADPRRDKTPALLRAMGRCVNTLGGHYVIAEDVGISVADVEVMAEETPHVTGVRTRGSGNPAPATAYGVHLGIKAAVRYRLGRETLAGLSVAVQGLGQVGLELCRLLAADGAQLIVTDIHSELVDLAVRELGARAMAPEDIYQAEADVFAPCALGAILNDETIPRLSARVVAGSANNQLAEKRHGQALRSRGILYAPDYAINAGGVIYVSHAGPVFDHARALAHVAGIHDTLLEIFARADRERIPTSRAADLLAEEHFRKPAEPRTVAA